MEEKYVLVVEDDRFYSKIYETKLSKEGIAARLAQNGNEALKILQEAGNPVLILLDLIMPGMDGFDTLKVIKTTESTKNIPVIVLSNLSQEEETKRVLAMGAQEYLIKANTPIGDIIDRVKKIVGK